MNFSKSVIAYLITAVSIPLSLYAQNMNSPYSVYGIGDIDYRMYNRTSGMAGTGMATRSSIDIINNNPAAIAGLPRSFLLIKAAGVGAVVNYAGQGVDASNSNNKDFWIKSLTLAIKINKFWASSIGFKQFSNVNYNFTGNKDVIGNNDTYPAHYTGDGGLNDYYWTNAFSIGKHLSLGIKSSIIAGGINQTESIQNSTTNTNVQTTQRDYYGDPRFEFGAIYTGAITKTWDLSLGGKYINQTNLGAERTLTVIQNNVTIVNDQFVKNYNFALPTTYSAGLSLIHNKRITFAGDYTYENWSPLNVDGNGWRMVNDNRISAGVEIAKHVQAYGQNFEKSYLQFGGFVTNGYLQVNNTPIREFGVTAGMGGAFSNNLLYSFALEGGSRGTTSAQLIRENFFRLTITLTYRDFLLSKGRKYD